MAFVIVKLLSSSIKDTSKCLRRESLVQKCRKWRLAFLSVIFMVYFCRCVKSHCVYLTFADSDTEGAGRGGSRVHRHHLRQLQERLWILIFNLSYHVYDLNVPWLYLFCSGAQSSGDIDILLTHPDFTAQSEKQVNVEFRNTHRVRSSRNTAGISVLQPKLLHAVVDHLESIGFITDTLSKGDTKFMVGLCLWQCDCQIIINQ